LKSDNVHALRRLEDENEQLRVALEEQRSQADMLACERQTLVDQIASMQRELDRSHNQMNQRHQDAMAVLQQKLSPSSNRLFREMSRRSDLEASEEELRVALEEMQVLAEELEDTNAALTLANKELDDRIAERTAELRAANETLSHSEHRLQLAQSVASAVSWEWEGAAGTFTWPEDFLRLHGMKAGDEQAWLDSIHPEDLDRVLEALRLCLRKGLPDFAVEYRVGHKDRKTRWLAARGRLLLDDHGEPQRMVGLTIDITTQKTAELALAGDNDALREQVRTVVAEREAAQARMFQAMKLEAIGQLTGGVAHDFNNLLAIIISGLSLLSRSHSEEERVSLTRSIEQAARRGAKLIHRLLSFARRQALKPEALDLQSWVTEMAELLTPSLRPDILVQTEVAPGAAALADRAELELAVLNLCLNARDAMPDAGTLTIAVRNLTLAPGEDPDGLVGAFVELSVTDTGEGMSEQTLERIFEPFFTTKGASQGTGLGLPQVYGFARQSGGIARAESVLGQGTTVRVLLPAAAAPVAGAHPAPLAPLPSSKQALRVLVVEDDLEVGNMATRLLRKLGHEVRHATTADSGLEELRQGGVDLLFTDVMLAEGGNGIDLALAAMQRWPTLPILLTSGYEAAPERLAATKLPLLRKPYDAEQLDLAIAKVLVQPHPQHAAAFQRSDM
jgi:PAS domain S-box-containing protein